MVSSLNTPIPTKILKGSIGLAAPAETPVRIIPALPMSRHTAEADCVAGHVGLELRNARISQARAMYLRCRDNSRAAEPKFASRDGRGISEFDLESIELGGTAN